MYNYLNNILIYQEQLQQLKDGAMKRKNNDDPESVYDAILQTAYCSDQVLIIYYIIYLDKMVC